MIFLLYFIVSISLGSSRLRQTYLENYQLEGRGGAIGKCQEISQLIQK